MQNIAQTLMPQNQQLTVELSGGLANQLFQWSAAKIVATQHGTKLIVDSRIVERPDARGEQISKLITSEQEFRHESRFGKQFWSIVYRYLPRLPKSAVKRFYTLITSWGKHSVSDNIDDTISKLKLGSPVLMRGLFQNSNFFYKFRDEILSNISIAGYRPQFNSEDKYAAVHIRRGDYLQNPKYTKMFGVCSESYYRNAIALLDTSLPIIIVTDDAPWAAKFAKSFDPSIHEITVSKASNHFEDLSILAGATELVLSNSTFSWWGAFMSEAVQVFCPDPWFTDVNQDWGLRRPSWINIPR